MSKVKIQGNASGTGIFTVAAPATNTDRTITLPDVDATVLTTAGGTIGGQLVINQNNSGGVAAISLPQDESTIQGPAANTAIRMGNNLVLRASVQTSIDTAGLGRVVIDSSGRVTMPYQPMFEARVTASPFWTATAGSVIPFNSIMQNTGNHFNTSTYKFTAPVTGLYWFGFQGYMGLASGSMRVIHMYFQINDSNARHCPQGGGTSGANSGYSIHPTFAATTLLKLNANDTVRMYISGVDTPSGTPVFYDDTRFYGYLIG